jgi:hypothetical protein
MMVRTAKRLDFERIDEGDLSIGSTQLGALPALPLGIPLSPARA